MCLTLFYTPHGWRAMHWLWNCKILFCWKIQFFAYLHSLPELFLIGKSFYLDVLLSFISPSKSMSPISYLPFYLDVLQSFMSSSKSMSPLSLPELFLNVKSCLPGCVAIFHEFLKSLPEFFLNLKSCLPGCVAIFHEFLKSLPELFLNLNSS